jgi:hypothetical protein
MPPPADPVKGYTIDELRALSSEDIKQVTDPFDDATLFGALFPYVPQLRSSLLPPETVAKYIFQAREAAVQQGNISPAMELLLAEQLEVLVERLFPLPATDEYRTSVIQALASAIEEEGDGDEGDDDGDDEGEGDDAQA